MPLPDIKLLESKWEECQSKDPVPQGFVAIIVKDRLGTMPFFVDDLDEWKQFWPAFVFFDVLFTNDLENADEEYLEHTLKIFEEFNNVEWNEDDFRRFGTIDPYCGSFYFSFCGKVADWIVEVARELRENISSSSL